MRPPRTFRRSAIESLTEVSLDPDGIPDDIPDDIPIDPEDLREAAAAAGLVEGVSATESESTEPILSPAPELESTEPILEPTPSLRPLRIRTAVPLAIDEDGLVLEVDGGGKTRLPFGRIQAMAVASVKGIASKPVVIVDFAINWEAGREPLRLIRLQSDRYDPRALVQGLRETDASNSESLPAIAALRIFLRQVLGGGDITPMPNPAAAGAEPLAKYESLSAYQRDVLMAEEAGGS